MKSNYRETLFAEVNGQPIRGSEVFTAVRRLLSEQEEEHYATTPNPDNSSYINAEGLQQYIERLALSEAAKAEGFIIDEDTVSSAIYELRSQCEDDAEWGGLLHEMGLTPKDLRHELTIDLYVDALFASRLAEISEPGDKEAKDFYALNKESMKIPESYTFIELEVSENPREAAAILRAEEGAKILSEANARGFRCSLTESLPAKDLPESLQSVLPELSPGKIASLPADDGTVVLIKLIDKTESRPMSEEEVLPGLKEYLKVMQHKALADTLIEEALEKAVIIYHNPELLKQLS